MNTMVARVRHTHLFLCLQSPDSNVKLMTPNMSSENTNGEISVELLGLCVARSARLVLRCHTSRIMSTGRPRRADGLPSDTFTLHQYRVVL